MNETPNVALKDVWTRLARNAAIVFGERAIFAIVNLAALAIVTRSVGVEAIGAIGLLIAFSAAVSTGLAFQSWQAVLRYGAEFRDQAPEKLERLLGATLLADVLAISATITIATAIGDRVGDWLGLPADISAAIPWFAALFVFGQVHMTNVGVLRLFDQVPIIAAQHAFIALVRLSGALLIWVFGGGVDLVLLTWGAANVAGGLVLWGGSANILRRQGLSPKLGSFSALGIRAKEFAGFLSVTNLVSTLEAAVHLTLMAAATAFLGVHDAGLFHLVRQVADALARPAEFLGPLIFPEIASLKAKREASAARSLVVRSSLSAVAIGVVPTMLAFAFGNVLMALVFGAEAAGTGAALTLALAASAVFVATFAIEPYLLTAGRSRATLISNVAPWVVLTIYMASFLDAASMVGIVTALLVHRIVLAICRLNALWISKD